MGHRFYRSEPFVIRGKLVRSHHKSSGRLKRLVIQSPQGLQELKCSKWCRLGAAVQLQPGVVLELSGLKTIKADKIKFEVFDVQFTPIAIAEPPSRVCDRIAVCRKQNCDRKGAALLWWELSKLLETTGLNQQVSLIPVQCLGHCKQGPVVKVQPMGIHHTQVKPSQARELIERYAAIRPVATQSAESSQVPSLLKKDCI